MKAYSRFVIQFAGEKFTLKATLEGPKARLLSTDDFLLELDRSVDCIKRSAQAKKLMPPKLPAKHLRNFKA